SWGSRALDRPYLQPNAPDGRASAHSPDGEGGLEQRATYDARDSFCQSIVRSAARRIAAPDSVEAARHGRCARRGRGPAPARCGTVGTERRQDQRRTGMRTLNGIDEIESLIGTELRSSQWVTMHHDAINTFADVTDDHQWIHVDAARAAEGPYGATIVHGFFTLALIPKFSSEIFAIEGVSMKINYGLNKVRFLQPVVVGSRLRGTVEVGDVIRGQKGTQLILNPTIEIEGEQRPACIAEVVTLLIE